MAYLAIDWGEKRIGLATGTFFPKGAGVLSGDRSFFQIADEIGKIAIENDVEKIIVGLPLRSQGEEGNLTQKIRKFAEAVSKGTGLSVVFEPEQFTSVEAEEILNKGGKKFSRQSGLVDEMAAILLLEQFLQSEGKAQND